MQATQLPTFPGLCLLKTHLELDEAEEEGRVLHPGVLLTEAIHLPAQRLELDVIEQPVGRFFEQGLLCCSHLHSNKSSQVSQIVDNQLKHRDTVLEGSQELGIRQETQSMEALLRLFVLRQAVSAPPLQKVHSSP